jgi:predicted nucleic acid-binding protein
VPVFVDTNVLVYARDAGEPTKQPQALAWLEHLWKSRSGRLSFQVLQEFYVTVTKKLDPGLSADEARAELRSLLAWRPVAVDGDVLQAAWSLEDRHSLSFWDALIVAAAQAAGCEQLLSEDLADGVTYGGVEVVNPFSRRPPALS